MPKNPKSKNTPALALDRRLHAIEAKLDCQIREMGRLIDRLDAQRCLLASLLDKSVRVPEVASVLPAFVEVSKHPKQ